MIKKLIRMKRIRLLAIINGLLIIAILFFLTFEKSLVARFYENVEMFFRNHSPEKEVADSLAREEFIKSKDSFLVYMYQEMRLMEKLLYVLIFLLLSLAVTNFLRYKLISREIHKAKDDGNK